MSASQKIRLLVEAILVLLVSSADLDSDEAFVLLAPSTDLDSDEAFVYCRQKMIASARLRAAVPITVPYSSQSVGSSSASGLQEVQVSVFFKKQISV